MVAKALALYIAHLIALIGTPYAKLNCSRYILAAHGNDLEFGNSSEMYYECGGRMVQVGAAHKDVVELSLYEDELQPGDVICFRAGHVSAYLGAGLMVGSGRNGVQVRRILDQFPLDNWYHGPIRVMEGCSRERFAPSPCRSWNARPARKQCWYETTGWTWWLGPGTSPKSPLVQTTV